MSCIDLRKKDMPWFELELLLKIVGIGFICSVLFSVMQKPKIRYDESM